MTIFPFQFFVVVNLCCVKPVYVCWEQLASVLYFFTQWTFTKLRPISKHNLKISSLLGFFLSLMVLLRFYPHQLNLYLRIRQYNLLN